MASSPLFSFLSSFLHSILPVFLSRQNPLLCSPRLASNSCLSLLSNSWEFRCVPRPSLAYIFFCEGSEHPCSMIFTVGSYKYARIAVCGTADSTSFRPAVLAVADLDLHWIDGNYGFLGFALVRHWIHLPPEAGWEWWVSFVLPKRQSFV